MTNLKARAATERFTVLFDNPEVTAMAAICEILQELPDEAARLRVMHWSFGRFNPEFKRSMAVSAAPQPPPVLVVTEPSPAAVPPAEQSLTEEIAAVAPDMTAAPETAPRDDDFGRQISELGDLFSGDVCRTPRRPIYADAF